MSKNKNKNFQSPKEKIRNLQPPSLLNIQIFKTRAFQLQIRLGGHPIVTTTKIS
jgi:hypothetical protein